MGKFRVPQSSEECDNAALNTCGPTDVEGEGLVKPRKAWFDDSCGSIYGQTGMLL